MTKEQKLSKFILGFEGTPAEEVNALRPTTLVDALIRAKAKLLSFQIRKRSNPISNFSIFPTLEDQSISETKF